MIPPDSGEREVCGSVIAKVNGNWLVCDMVRGHDGAHTAKLTDWLSAHGIVSLPFDLAQRILAALEQMGDLYPVGIVDWRLLAAELRAAVERNSGKECGHLLSQDMGAEWRCGKPKGHEGPHSGVERKL